MKYILISQLYWPVWIIFHINNYSIPGMIIGTLLVILMWSVTYNIEFGSFKFWS